MVISYIFASDQQMLLEFLEQAEERLFFLAVVWVRRSFETIFEVLL